MVKGAALELAFERPKPEVQSDNNTQDTKKITASQAVNFLSTSAVDVPNKESPPSPPKEAPRPVLLLSWIKTTKQRIAHKIMNKKIAVKYKKVIMEVTDSILIV